MSQSNEYLLNNALTEDFQQMMRPYYLAQQLLCASKYRIKDNFVVPNSKAYCAVPVLALCFVTYTFFTVSFATSCTLLTQCPLITNMHSLLAHFIATTCVIVQTTSSVKLVIVMQGIDRQLKSLGVPKLSYFVRRNWCFIIFILLIFGFGISVTASNTDRYPLKAYFGLFLTMTFDVDMLYASCVVEFFASRLKCFSELFLAHVNNPLNLSLDGNSNGTFNKLFKIFEETLEAFTLFSDLVQYTVFGYVLSTFIASLVALQTLIESAKDVNNFIYKNASVTYVLAVVRITKTYFMIIMYSVICERFYRRLDDIKSSCAVALDSALEADLSRKTAKNILRMCDARFCKMRVCDLFCVDAALPLRLAGLVATYCIVLLQFAFL